MIGIFGGLLVYFAFQVLFIGVLSITPLNSEIKRSKEQIFWLYVCCINVGLVSLTAFDFLTGMHGVVGNIYERLPVEFVVENNFYQDSAALTICFGAFTITSTAFVRAYMLNMKRELKSKVPAYIFLSLVASVGIVIGTIILMLVCAKGACT